MTTKTVLVTGCSSGGLGYALAKAFRERGCCVFATARDTSKVTSPLTEDDGIEVLALDVTSPESIETCVQQVRDRTDKIDILVNNAGVAIFGPLVHASISEGKALYDVNFWGVLAVAQAFTPLLVRSSGVMMNICSIGATNPLAWQGEAHDSVSWPSLTYYKIQEYTTVPKPLRPCCPRICASS